MRQITAAELLRMPDEDLRTELVRGRLVRVFGADTGFVLSRDPDTVRAPDAAFVAAGRLPEAAPATGYAPLAPDLAVEVLSPSNSAAEIQAKVLDYLEAGSRMVWIVDAQARTVTVYRGHDIELLNAPDTLDGGDVLPGFCVTVAELLES